MVLTKCEVEELLANKPNAWKELKEAVSKGDVAKISKLVKEKHINLREDRDYTKILLTEAIRNDNGKVLKVLFEKGAKVGGVLFTAVRHNAFECVKTIVERIKKNKEANDLGPNDVKPEANASSEAEEHFMSPLMAALHQSNSYDILDYFISKGYHLEDSKFGQHTLSTPKNQENYQTLSIPVKPRMIKSFTEQEVIAEFKTYQAKANPLYSCYMFIHDKYEDVLRKQCGQVHSKQCEHVRSKPLLKTIFDLNTELLKRSRLNEDFEAEYKKESEKCEDFSVDLMDQCRSFKEVKILADLKEDGKMGLLEFLRQVIKEGNEKLVAHPYSQMCLNKVMYDDIYTVFESEPKWRDRSYVNITMFIVRHVLLLPFLALAHIVYPSSSVSRVLENPMVKYISHFWSNLFFVTLLILSSFQDKFDKEIMKPSIPEWIILLWLLGMISNKVQEFCTQGISIYFKQLWNTLSLFMIIFFLCSYTLRLYAFGTTGNSADLDHVESSGRTSQLYKIILVSNSFFSIGMLLSFILLSDALQTNKFLGPLQLSLRLLLLDVIKFMLFFFLIFVGFGLSLRKLYSNYINTQLYMAEQAESKNGSKPETDHHFSKTYTSFHGLFWSLFGVTDLTRFSTKDRNLSITKETGEVLFAVFQVVAAIVAINMLIAMMSKSYDNITTNAIMKWRVSRTRLMLVWVKKGSVLPPPLNLIPNVYYLWGKMKDIVTSCKKHHGVIDCSNADSEKQTLDNQELLKKRKETVKKILRRYINARKKRDDEDQRKTAQASDEGIETMSHTVISYV